jgi:hypothetical protein
MMSGIGNVLSRLAKRRKGKLEMKEAEKVLNQAGTLSHAGEDGMPLCSLVNCPRTWGYER